MTKLRHVLALVVLVTLFGADHAMTASQNRQGGDGALLQTTGAFFALSVPDARASARWYEQKLGLKIIMDSPRTDQTRTAAIVLRGGGLTVELLQLDQAVPLKQAAPSVSERAFVHGFFKAGVVVSDFDAALAALRARAVEIAMGPWPAQGNQPANVIIKDRDGNMIQIFGR